MAKAGILCWRETRGNWQEEHGRFKIEGGKMPPRILSGKLILDGAREMEAREFKEKKRAVGRRKERKRDKYIYLSA